MNIFNQIFESNFSNHVLFNSTGMELIWIKNAADIITILLSFPTNSYVIWLIVTGTGNGLASELFSLNLSICEIFFCMDCFINVMSDKVENLWIFLNFLDGLFLTGRPLFNCLICVERYLAVVHPVTFLKLKPLRYRVICCAFAWIASFVFGGFNIITVLSFWYYLNYIFIMADFSCFFFIQLFCLVAVLRALKQSGPGDRKREVENHMKRKAFLIIFITAGTMLILFFPFMILFTISTSMYDGQTVLCFGYVCLTLAGLVQPLLFLYRVRKLPFINKY